MDQQIINIIAERIKQGEIGVIPTDTIYGIVCSAFNENSVEKLYKIRKRNKDKPMIILIGSVNDLKLFNIDAIVKNWPEKTSIVFDCNDFEYLHRGKRSLAFRLPHNKDLIDIYDKKISIETKMKKLIEPEKNDTNGGGQNYTQNNFYGTTDEIYAMLAQRRKDKENEK